MGAIVIFRAIAVLLAGSSGISLLAKVYGLAPMSQTVPFVVLPAGCGLFALWVWARRRKPRLASAIGTGFLGGLIGTLAYDVVRLPLHWTGVAVYVPISIYGVWIADAQLSSRYTETLGWLYHFSNGTTFGVLYSVVVGKRRWLWAMVWGLLLESIALASPFGRIFGMVGDSTAIAVAYFGHVAYGIGLGWSAEHATTILNFLSRTPRVGYAIALAAALASVTYLHWPQNVARDARAGPSRLLVDDQRLNPRILRPRDSQTVHLVNPEVAPLQVEIRHAGRLQRFDVNGRSELPLRFVRPGIHQVYPLISGRTSSGFVLVEPVEDAFSSHAERTAHEREAMP